MILTQAYTSIFGAPSREDFITKANCVGRYVVQTIDLSAPIILVVMGILSVNSFILTPTIGYISISVGSTLGLTQFFLILNHNILPKYSNIEGHHTTPFLYKIYLNIYEPNR